MSTVTKVGCIGLGAMGLGMASCLARDGFVVRGFDIHRGAIQRLLREGGEEAADPRAAASDADVLLLMVATSQQTISVLFDDDTGALESLPENAIILLCVTASPDDVVDVENRLRALGRTDVGLIDCPVSGGEIRARDGTLSLLCAGQNHHISAAKGVLECLGSKLHILPGPVGSASSLKMVHQILVGVNILATIEVMGLAYLAKLELQSVYDSVMNADGASWLFGQRAAHLLDENRVPASSLAIIAKDLEIVTSQSRRLGLSLPMASITQQLYTLAISAGWGTADDCVVMNIYLLGRGKVQDLQQPQQGRGSNSPFSKSTITDLLMGINTAATLEAFGLADRLGVDQAALVEFVRDAAGSSVAFNNFSCQLNRSTEFSAKLHSGFNSISRNLATAISVTKSLNYPLLLSTTALQQYYGR